MEKDPMSFRERSITTVRLLREVTLGFGNIGLSQLPPSKYLSR
jgi:hypothetical protein